MKTCSVDGCGNKHLAKGFCAKHYMRYRAHGDPLAGRTYRGEPKAFLNEVLDGNSTPECIRWPFAHSSTGYAVIQKRGKLTAVHRLVCGKVHGPPKSKGMVAAHTCGNEWCINPAHLAWATPQQNSHDRLKHGTTKFSEKDVHDIRGRLKSGASVSELAREYSATRLTIRSIRDRVTWQLAD